MNAGIQFASMQLGAVAQIWWLLPEETRASIIESIGNAMNSMLEKEKREVRLLQESLEQEPQHVDD